MKKEIIIMLALMLTFNVKSQNLFTPWIVGVSTDYFDFHVVDRQFEDFFTKTDWMGSNFPSGIKLGHRINNSFTISGTFSYVSLEVDKLNEIPLKDTIFNDYCLKSTFQAEYKFANGYLLTTKSWFDPYLLLGAGISQINNEPLFTQVTGVGSNFWLSGYVGISFQASYNFLPDFDDFMHYSVSITARLGMADKDKDRVSNRKDKCPEIPGVELLSGCPDYDKDGIEDHLDRCPREFGTPEFNGCLDSDHDGISDSFDRCPGLPGSSELNGCPDMDFDGIPDIDDECPNISGTKTNLGCPEKEKIQEQKNDSLVLEQVALVTINPGTDFKDSIAELINETKLPNNLTIASPKSTTLKKYQIVGGVFRNHENAKNVLQEYQMKGYQPELVGLTSKGYYWVIIASYNKMDDALTSLKTIRTILNPNAWISVE